ncbi:MAG: hypothetical protein ACR2GC_10160 [Methyloceanibacter sp.]|uniref:hypothetical protein n=1 Tax=Methyloceanibacter sp. TaxID=1965321 RepID=UPI003D9AC08E
MGEVIPFKRTIPPVQPRRGGDPDNDVEAILWIMRDLPYRSRILLLTGVMLRVIQEVTHTDTYAAWQYARAFARGLYAEIRTR